MQRQAMWRNQSDRLADTVKLGMLVGELDFRIPGWKSSFNLHGIQG
jgi:hypothetical protein